MLFVNDFAVRDREKGECVSAIKRLTLFDYFST